MTLFSNEVIAHEVAVHGNVAANVGSPPLAGSWMRESILRVLVGFELVAEMSIRGFGPREWT